MKRNPLRLAGLAVATSVSVVLTIPILMLGLPFWLFSALTRGVLRVYRWMRPPETPWHELIEYEPVVGWKPKPNLDAHARAGDLFRLTTDSEGWRGRTSLERSDLVVFGDSFAFGQAASDDTFFADLHPEVRIKAVGSNGYNMVQCLLWMDRYAPRLQGKTVVWLIYYGNDLFENLQPNFLQYRMPFVRRRNDGDRWEIVTDHVSPRPWPLSAPHRYSQKLAEICTPGSLLSERAFGACEYLVGRARDLCRRSGARLAIVGNPDVEQIDPRGIARLAGMGPDPERFDPGLPDRRLREICASIGVPFTALSEHLEVEDHLDHDCHWAPRGHRRVAEVMAGIHEELTSRPDREDRSERAQGSISAGPSAAARGVRS